MIIYDHISVYSESQINIKYREPILQKQIVREDNQSCSNSFIHNHSPAHQRQTQFRRIRSCP